MTPEELKQIEEIVKKHSSSDSSGCTVLVLFLLFILGFFKGCGY